MRSVLLEAVCSRRQMAFCTAVQRDETRHKASQLNLTGKLKSIVMCNESGLSATNITLTTLIPSKVPHLVGSEKQHHAKHIKAHFLGVSSCSEKCQPASANDLGFNLLLPVVTNGLFSSHQSSVTAGFSGHNSMKTHHKWGVGHNN